jgi:hypothetical protein
LSYLVHSSDADRAYLANLPLSDEAKEAVEDFIGYAIADVDDAFRNDPANRPYPGQPYFETRLLLLDRGGDGRLHVVHFIVNDAGAPSGVLLVVYVEHQ